MPEQQSNKKLILKSFLTYSLVLLGIIALLSAYAFTTTRKALLNSISDMNVSLTQQAYDFTEQFYEMVRSYSANVFNSRSVKHLRKDAELSNGDYIDGMRELRTYVSSTDYVHSIYLYNGKTDYIHTTLDSDVSKGSASADTYFDKEAAQLLRSGESGGPFYRTFPYGGADGSVISFLTSEISDTPEKTVSSMLVNISPRWLEKFMDSLAGMRDLGVYLTDGTALIEAPDRHLSQETVSDLLQFSDSDKEGTDGYVIRRINGEKCVCFLADSSLLNCRFIRVLSYKDCLQDVLVFRRNMILVILALAVLGMAGCALIVRKFYIPARKLLDTAPLQDAEYGSLSSLDDVIDLAADRLESYSDLMKTDFLRQLLLFRSSAPVTQDQLDRRRIGLSADKSVMLVLIKNTPVLSGISGLPDDLQKERVEIDGKAVYLVQGTGRDLDSFLTVVSGFAGFCSFTPEKELSALGSSYAKALEIYNLRLFLSTSGSGACSTDLLHDRGDTVYPKRTEMRIISALTSGTTEKTDEYLKEFISQIAESSRYNVLKAHLTQLYCTVAEFDNSPIYAELDPGVYFEMELYECDSMEALEKLYGTLFHRVAEQNRKAKLERNAKLIERVKDYLETNYMDTEITPVSLAEVEGVSPDTLSELFKQTEETSIQKYLLQIRLGKAEQLLCSTTIPVKEIAKMVGFSNPQYFFTLFKGAYGTTPSSYRENNTLRKTSDP